MNRQSNSEGRFSVTQIIIVNLLILAAIIVAAIWMAYGG